MRTATTTGNRQYTYVAPGADVACRRSDASCSFEELRQMLSDLLPAAKVNKYLDTVVETVSNKKKVRPAVFDLMTDNIQQIHLYALQATASSASSLREAILQAVFEGGDSVKLKPKLEQAMRWDRLSLARESLQKYQGQGKVDAEVSRKKYWLWCTN